MSPLSTFIPSVLLAATTVAAAPFTSHFAPLHAELDPHNRLFARQARLRLDAELVRDVALVASGVFSPAVGGPPVYPPIPAGATGLLPLQKELRIFRKSVSEDPCIDL